MSYLRGIVHKMARTYWIESGLEDCYKVSSVKTSHGKIVKSDTYTVDLRNNHCNCPGFWYKHKCIHLKSVLDLLKAGKIAIYHHKAGDSYYSTFDFKERGGGSEKHTSEQREQPKVP